MSVTYIDVNRLNSIDYESEDTHEWNYSLNKNIVLPTGSQVSIQNTLINQKGILGNSIEIEQDIEETICANVYVSEDHHIAPDQIPFAVRNSCNPYVTLLAAHNHGALFDANTPAEYVNLIYRTGTGAIKTPDVFGGSQQPLILYEKTVDATGTAVIAPVLIKKTFKVPKGTYGINQLSDFITDQINGKKKVLDDNSIADTNPIDLQVEAGTFKGAYQLGAGFTATLNKDNEGIEDLNDSNNGSLNVNDIKFPFISNEEHVENIQFFNGLKIERNHANFIGANHYLAHLRDNQRARLSGHPFNETPDEYLNVANYRLGRIGYTIGAPEFNISYDTARNGYVLKNLHQSYKPPTIDFLGNPISNAGSDCIGVRQTFGKDTVGTSNPFQNPPTSGGDHSISRNQILSSLHRPRSRTSGAIIYNFALLTAIQEGDSEVTVLNANTGCAKFKDFFTTDEKAKKAWSKTIWSRMGFSYEQLNQKEHREDVISYDRNVISTLEGITTDNDFDMGMNQSISNQICPTTYIPQGTGESTDNIQTFSIADYNSPKAACSNFYPDAHNSLYNNIKSYAGSISGDYTIINVQVQDRPIVARNLPTLSVYGYYLITSNIVPAHDDIVQKATPLPLLGIVPKSSLSNQDFISVENQIVHTLRNPLVTNNIKIQVLNPDLTPANLNSNSSVILKIITPEVEEEEEK